MNNGLLWKFILIGAVVAAALFVSVPPEEKVDLGLDLQGGLHIVLQVDTSSAVKYELDAVQSYVGNRLKKDSLSYASIIPTDETTIEVRGTDPASNAAVEEALGEVVSQWDISSPKAGTWRLRMPADYAEVVKRNAVLGTLETMRNRIDALGVSEPVITEQGTEGNRILVQLPGVQDPERAKEIISEPAKLEWKEVTFPPGLSGFNPLPTKEGVIALFGGVLPDDTDLFEEEILTETGETISAWWPLKRVSVVSGNDLRNAYRTSNEWNDAVVAFELNSDGAGRFEAATRANVGKPMAILIDSKVLSAPRIESVIRDSGVVRGGFTIESAEDLALKLRSGAIPADVRTIEESTVGPSLGQDSIRKGLTAGGVGFIGVMLFMLFYYRLSGVNAVIALVLNVILIFGILAALPLLMNGARATLTLPGIAGLILTVGMAVDSNVLIFERIREELSMGKTVRSAVDQGFGKAFTTILDCNITTLFAAFFLFSYGTGPVKGFAVTLTIGLLASMFTAVFVSRQLFELVLRLRANADSLSI